MEFVFLAKLMRCVTMKKQTVETGFLKANRQTVHSFEMHTSSSNIPVSFRYLYQVQVCSFSFHLFIDVPV